METQTKRIEVTEATFTDQTVRVVAGCTVFADAHACTLITQGELCRSLNALMAKCKSSGCRLYRKGYKELLEQYSDYEESVTLARELFSQYSEAWQLIVERGIYAPTITDEDIKAAGAIRARLEPLFYRSTIISQMQRMDHNIQGHLKSDLSKYKFIRL